MYVCAQFHHHHQIFLYWNKKYLLCHKHRGIYKSNAMQYKLNYILIEFAVQSKSTNLSTSCHNTFSPVACDFRAVLSKCGF